MQCFHQHHVVFAENALPRKAVRVFTRLERVVHLVLVGVALPTHSRRLLLLFRVLHGLLYIFQLCNALSQHKLLVLQGHISDRRQSN